MRKAGSIRWLLGRIAQSLLTLVMAVVVLFFLMRLTPGDPLAELSQERQVPPAAVEHLRRMYQLDQPLLTQFSSFAGGLLRGDLGPSIHYQNRPVTALLRERLPASLLLGGTVLLLNFTFGLWLGVRQAVAKDRPTDRWLTTISLAGYAMPSFWLGLLLAWAFGTTWHLLPVAGMHEPTMDESAGILTRSLDVLRHLILPAITLSAVSVASTMRHQRSAMIEIMRRDFVRTARSKGLTERSVVWRHAWRNALFPVLTLLGLWLPILAAGSVFVEYIFAWPGLGQLAEQAISGRDYPLIMGTALLVATMVVAGGLVTDLAYVALDPRVRFRG